jgi:formylmethanofuran dehydrogenase subunit E
MSSLPPELESAKRFHGHLGPYLALGLRLGKALVAALSKTRC